MSLEEAAEFMEKVGKYCAGFINSLLV